MRPDTCKHFNGVQNGKCEAGVPYDQFRTPGLSMLNTMPCFARNEVEPCPKREAPTVEELKAYEAECELAMSNVLTLDRMIKALRAIAKRHAEERVVLEECVKALSEAAVVCSNLNDDLQQDDPDDSRWDGIEANKNRWRNTLQKARELGIGGEVKS